MTTNSLDISSIAHINFTAVPPPSEITQRQISPFRIAISAIDDSPHEVILYSQGSRSSPLKLDGNKWSHLIPTWRFLDTSFNPITSITTIDTPISSGNTFIGVTGEASFYYVDDLSTDVSNPVYIWATLDVFNVPYESDTALGDHAFPSFINSRVTTVVPYYVNSISPNKLKITRNGISDMSTSYYWASTSIANTITINGDSDALGSACLNDLEGTTIVYDYPSSNAHGISMGEITKSIVGISQLDQRWTSLENSTSASYFQELDSDLFRIGGYVRNFVYPQLSSLNTMITAGADVTYLSRERTLPFAWINNSSNNRLHRIYDIPTISLSALTATNPYLSGATSEISVIYTPYITIATDYTPLTGFGGGFGVALDPCYNAWVSDYEMDYIYKYDSQGTILSAISLNGKKKLDSVDYTLSSSRTSGTDFEFVSSANFDATITINASANSNAFVFDIEVPNNTGVGDYYRSFVISLSSSGNVLYSRNNFLILGTTPTTVSVSALNEEVFDDTVVVSYKVVGYNQPTANLPTPNLSATGAFFASQPAGISLDGSGDLWVAFFNDNSVAKIDATTGEILVVSTAVDYGDPYNLEELTVRSTLTETDGSSNVWVSYNHPLSSKLVKLDSNGVLLGTKVLPLCSEPVDMIFDLDGYMWMTLAKTSGPPYLSGGVWKINPTDMSLVSGFSAINPEYITIDKNNDVWFTQSFNTVTKIDSGTGIRSDFSVGAYPTLWFDTSANMEYTALEGIASDTFGRVWVVNTYESKVYVLSEGVVEKTFVLYDDKLVLYNDSGYQYSLSSEFAQSLQCFGDWTGIRWLSKYYPEYMSAQTVTKHITGQSDLFSIDDFSGYYHRKFNESWDATNQVRDYALAFHIYQNYNLFVNYLGAMVGGVDNGDTQIARYVYERVANFVANHQDPDTANVDQLYSLLKELDVPVDDYRLDYPFDIERIMNIGSISHGKLWGNRCTCTENFSYGEVCKNCGHEHGLNVGGEINTSTYVISAGIPFLATYRYSPQKYEVINSPISSSSFNQTVSTYLYNSPDEYTYYEYDRTQCGVLVEGVINWDDPYTTISRENSGLSAWYDKGQLLEKLFSIYLHKGCGI